MTFELIHLPDLLAYVQTNGQPQMPGNMLYWVIIIGSMVLSMIVGNTMKRRVQEYSRIPIPMTGREVAEKMLRDNGINDVKVTSVQGMLTDHYNPGDKTVNLSEGVYASNSVAAAAVAAHEVGHAVQHAHAYHWLTLRSTLVPVVSLSSKLVQIVLIVGIVLLAGGGSPWVLGVGVALFAMTTLFAFVTLPVEFDASRRALVWLNKSRVLDYMGNEKAKSALFWAAMTYVVGALSSLAMLLYYAMMFLGAQRRD